MKTHFTRYSLVYKDLHALGGKANLLLHNMKVRLGDALNNFPNFVNACVKEHLMWSLGWSSNAARPS